MRCPIDVKNINGRGDVISKKIVGLDDQLLNIRYEKEVDMLGRIELITAYNWWIEINVWDIKYWVERWSTEITDEKPFGTFKKDLPW